MRARLKYASSALSTVARNLNENCVKMKLLPERYLRLMSPADRKAIGQSTAEEALRKAEAKNERQLQSQIVQLLRLKGIEPLWHRTDKRSAATIGWPDITFAVRSSQLNDDGTFWIAQYYPCA